MKQAKTSKSLRKYICRKKAQIRREALGPKQEKELIDKFRQGMKK